MEFPGRNFEVLFSGQRARAGKRGRRLCGPDGRNGSRLRHSRLRVRVEVAEGGRGGTGRHQCSHGHIARNDRPGGARGRSLPPLMLLRDRDARRIRLQAWSNHFILNAKKYKKLKLYPNDISGHKQYYVLKLILIFADNK